MDLHASPEWIVSTAEPRDLLKAAEVLPQWDDAARANIDHALCQWTHDACARGGDVEGLHELQMVAGWLIDLAPKHADSRHLAPMQARWQGFLDLLEAHRIVLAARDPEKLRQRKHVAPILAALQAGELEQKVLRERCGLSESRLAQLLSLMEAHGLVVRRKEGRVNIVRTAEKTQVVKTRTEGSHAVAPAAGKQDRFASYLKAA
jgi:hypothetical protein